MAEQRQNKRWQIDYKAQVKLEGALAYARCFVHDINFKGLKISLDQKLPVDTFIDLKVVLSGDFVLDVKAWVVWHKRIMGVDIHGIYFTKIKDEDKESIYKFVRSNFAEQVNEQWYKDIGQEKGGEIMVKPAFEDRRIFERFPAGFSVKFLDLNTNKEGLARAHNVSAKGIGFITAEPLTTRTPLEMWLQVVEGSEPLYARGEVIWIKPTTENEYRVGVNLEKAELMGLAAAIRRT